MTYDIDSNLELSWDRDKDSVINSKKELDRQDRFWNNYLENCTPMGSLINSNPLDKNSDFVLLHFTPHKRQIIKSKILYTSGGGLGVCVYGVPMFNNGEMHNLGLYLLNNELPMFMKNSKKNCDVLALKLSKESLSNDNSVLRVNYLEWGNYYLKAFDASKDSSENTLFTNDLLADQFAHINKYVLKLENLTFLQGVKASEFVKLFDEAIQRLQFLRVVYFESVIEYLFLFQDSKKAMDYKRKFEMFNDDVKNTIFAAAPKMRSRFTLDNFTVSLNTLSKHIKKGNYISDHSRLRFINFVKWRTSHNLRSKLMNMALLLKPVKDSEQLRERSPHLLGHLLFRTFRGKLNLEAELSKILLNRWGQMGVKVVCYTNIPKGEMGIVPLASGEVEVYDTQVNNRSILLGHRVDVRLTPKLIDPLGSVMRSPLK